MVNHAENRDQIRDEVQDILEQMVNPEIQALTAIIPIYPDDTRDLWLIKQRLIPEMMPILKQKLRMKGPVAVATIMENIVLEFKQDISEHEVLRNSLTTGRIDPKDIPDDLVEHFAHAIVVSYQTRLNTFTSHAEINEDATLGEWSPWEESGYGMMHSLLSLD